MLLIQKGKPTKQVCGYCHKASESGRAARPRARIDKCWVCAGCSQATIQEALEKFRIQVESGMPDSMQYVEMPMDFLRFMDDRWFEELREGLLSIEAECGTARTIPSLPSPYCISAAR